jgi:hypothetical protein
MEKGKYRIGNVRLKSRDETGEILNNEKNSFDIQTIEK